MRHKLAFLFVLIALPTCATLAVLVPPGQVADEPGHLARAAALVQGHLHGERRLVTGGDGRRLLQSGVLVDPDLWHVMFVLHPGGEDKLDARRRAAHRALGWTGSRIFVEVGTIALYFPVFYLPGAAGLGVAELLRVPPYDAVIAGRLCSALCFVAIGAAALLVARRGRALMFCALACPMTLSLAASFNQDGLLIAGSALAASLASRPGPRRVAAALIAIVAAVKLPYVPLAALLLTGPGLSWRRAGLASATALPALLWTATMLASVSAPVDRPPHVPGPLWPGDPATIFSSTDPMAQLRVLLAEPARLVWLPASTLIHDPWLLRQGIGVLGWLNVQLPESAYQAWMVALAGGLLADLLAARGQEVRMRDTLLIAAAAVASVWAIYISQYLTWTDVGLARINGPSGRYFLPLLPLAGLAMPSLRLPAPAHLGRIATAVPVLVAAAGVALLPAVMVGAYYLR